MISLPDKRTYNQIEEGDEILLDDGKITLLVDEVLADKIKCLVLNDGIIKSRRTFAIKGKEVSGPALTQKDINDVKYAVSKGFDYVALSFVRSIGDIERLRKLLRELGEEDMKIIAKIETRSAVEKIDEIISEADAVLVARGDLGMYFKLVEIPKIQELIIKKALAYGKPSIVATQLLESMVNNPIPTRSEVVDIMKAVEQGADALMLSNETAIGKYPVESVRWLRKIIEASPPCERVIEGVNETIYDKFAKGIVLLAESLGAKIVAFTRSGATARRLSRYRPRVPVYTVTNDKRVSRQLKILRGISSCYLEDASPENFWEKASKILEDKGELSSGDIVIVIRGMRKEATDLVRIEKL
ncbi:MAG: pyruvate kinase [Desulfurococcales archaeon ex4484_217_2]|nr:MAG: pyruvate kinase [Desulfurococcales archaeon ex4484_217_2]